MREVLHQTDFDPSLMEVVIAPKAPNQEVEKILDLLNDTMLIGTQDVLPLGSEPEEGGVNTA